MPPAEARAPEKFPSTFYYANGIELFERLAHYGMYVGLSLYLTTVVGYGDLETGFWLGNFRLAGSLMPIPCGSIADRITFKRSLVIAFCLYATGYLVLFAFPSRLLAPPALLCLAAGGGFVKPVIMGTVVRTAPEGRQTEGFSVYYRMVNAGSAIGKPLAYLMRTLVALRFVMLNSVAASLIALSLSIFGYEEPTRGAAKRERLAETLRGYGKALRNLRFVTFLVIFAGFYFMAEQFYMTFPKYVTRHIDAKAKFEFITLINPALIALFQGSVTRATRRFTPVGSMLAGMLIASLSMLVMGTLPGLAGACVSGAIFALAEMSFSPRYFDYIASFAPEGKAGMYMGLAFVPMALGAWVGGPLSGFMISRYLPAEGPREPFTVWASYAGIGLGCAVLMVIYRAIFPSAEVAKVATA
jgi:POT family proton-dependent oligopeptide transporter